MGANAAVKCVEILKNVSRILAIEWCTATQAFEFRRPLQSSPKVEEWMTSLRNQISFLEVDRDLGIDLRRAEHLLWSRMIQD
jgi:histidine ammonia-lyase